MSLVSTHKSIVERPTNVPKTPSNILIEDEFFILLIFSNNGKLLCFKSDTTSSINEVIFTSA